MTCDSILSALGSLFTFIIPPILWGLAFGVGAGLTLFVCMELLLRFGPDSPSNQ